MAVSLAQIMDRNNLKYVLSCQSNRPTAIFKEKLQTGLKRGNCSYMFSSLSYNSQLFNYGRFSYIITVTVMTFSIILLQFSYIAMTGLIMISQNLDQNFKKILIPQPRGCSSDGRALA
ncbi:hypothetical protein ACTFIV_006761 [Dictyostelium citrinum]